MIGGSPRTWGDVDCKNGINPVDALKLLRFDAGLLSIGAIAGGAACPDIGSSFTIDTPSPTPTVQGATVIPTPTISPGPTPTATPTPTPTPTPTAATQSPPSPSPPAPTTQVPTATVAPTSTATATATVTPTPTPSFAATPTLTVAPTITATPTATFEFHFYCWIAILSNSMVNGFVPFESCESSGFEWFVCTTGASFLCTFGVLIPGGSGYWECVGIAAFVCNLISALPQAESCTRVGSIVTCIGHFAPSWECSVNDPLIECVSINAFYPHEPFACTRSGSVYECALG